MQEKLARFDIDLDELTQGEENENFRFPFLWVYGRKDFTISVMGANIYPEDLEQCLYADEALSKITKSFCMSLSEHENGEVRPAFYFEITVEPGEVLEKQFGDSILSQLVDLNADFREAWHEYPETLVPEIHLFREGEGPFKSDQGKIKQARLIKQ
jgi:phenylacetate-CoA ligase